MKVSISTKTGDKGTSGLANGERLAKSDPLFEVIGTVDELNAWLGLVNVGLSQEPEKQAFIIKIQENLFHIGAELARSPKTELSIYDLRQLELSAQKLEYILQLPSKFIQTVGSQQAGVIDVARTVCRRCERLAVAYNEATPISPLILQYLNRLSDYLYLLRRFIDHKEHKYQRQFTVIQKPKSE